MTGIQPLASSKWQRDRIELFEEYFTWLQNNPRPEEPSAITSCNSTNVGMDDLDQPVALRRSKRRSEAISPIKQSTNSFVDGATPTTPSRARSKKRVRFSSPSPTLASCGLTPFVGRATLNTPRRHVSTPANIRSEPIEIQFTPIRQVLDERVKRRIRRNGLSDEMNAYEADRKDKKQLQKELQAKDMELQKLRSELEAAKQANTENANHQAVEQLSSSQRIVEAELETLRQSFNENHALDPFDDDMDINWDAVNVFKASDSLGPGSDGGDTIPIYEDDADIIMPSTSAPEAANAAGNPVVETTADEELLVMALDLEAHQQEKRQLFKDLKPHLPKALLSSASSNNSASSLRFEDSPAQTQQFPPSLTTSMSSLPSPPKTFYSDLSKALKSTTNRAESAELALHALESDLFTLGFTGSDNSSATDAIDNIRSHFRQARLDLEHALPGETTIGLNQPSKVFPEAISKLKMLSRRVQEREAELKTMHEQQRTLKGNFECSLRAAEKANQRIKELEEAIDQSAEDMLNMRMKLQATEKDDVEKDHTITSLIAALEKYREDVARLEGLVIRLENEQSFKIQEAREENEQKISDLEAKVAAEETGRRKAEESAVTRGQRLAELQAALDATTDAASALQLQISALETQKTETETALATQQAEMRTALQHSETSLAQQQELKHQHETQLQSLNTRLSSLSTALSASHAETTKLTSLVSKFQSRLAVTEDALERAVERPWEEQIRAMTKCAEMRKSELRGMKVRKGNWEMEDGDVEEGTSASERGPMTPVSLVRFVDVEAEGDIPDPNDDGEVEGQVEISRGRGRSKLRRSYGGLGLGLSAGLDSKSRRKEERRRRRLDSGLGMGTVSEEDEGNSEMTIPSDAILPSSDSGLPESETGFEIHEDCHGIDDVALPSLEGDGSREDGL
jgi:hypothetical protein